MGYDPGQLRDLEATLNRAEADLVIDATPVDLSRLIHGIKPFVRVGYEVRERGRGLVRALEGFERKHLKAHGHGR